MKKFTNSSKLLIMEDKKYNKLLSILCEIKEDIATLKAREEKELLTPKEVQETLKISKTTYQRYLDNKVFTQIKIEGKAYVEHAEIERLITEGKI